MGHQPADPALRRSVRQQRGLLAIAAFAIAIPVLSGMVFDFDIGPAGWFGLVLLVVLVYWLLARSSRRA